MTPKWLTGEAGWRALAGICYFALVAIFALAILVLAPLGALPREFLSVTAAVSGVGVYAAIQIIGQARKLPGIDDPVWAQVETTIAVLGVAVLSWYSFQVNSVLFTSIFVGAMGA